MSWDAYVESFMESNLFMHVAIASAEDGELLAKSPDFPENDLSALKEIAHTLNSSDQKKAFENGFKFMDNKFVTLRAEPNILYARAKKTCAIAIKTQTVLLFGLFDAGDSPSGAPEPLNYLQSMGDYLVSQGC